MNLSSFIHGLIAGGVLVSIILVNFFLDKINRLNNSNIEWRKMYIEHHGNAVKYFSLYIKFRGLASACKDLISNDFGYGGDWQSEHGRIIKAEADKALKDNP